jgi:hypothetical protein
MINLTNGYYWLKNYSNLMEKDIFRPIRITVIEESGYYFSHQWYSPGTYFQWIGDDAVYHINYIIAEPNPFEGVEFIKLEEPS